MKNECYYDEFDRKENLAFDSKVVHGGMGCDPITGAVSFPIFQTATFRHRAFGISTGYDYTRVQNPTRQELERTMAILENGLEGFAFSSGQAANMALFTWLPNNSHVILSDDITAAPSASATRSSPSSAAPSLGWICPIWRRCVPPSGLRPK